MSYCVNCGVELEESLKRCPLCNTPVLNPNLMNSMDKVPPYPYPQKRGQVDTVKRTDIAILISVILVGTAIACGLLNLLVYQQNHWSFYVIGACILLWIFFTPMLLYTRLSVYLTLLLDAAAVALYIGVIAYELPHTGWYLHLALPIVGLLTILFLIYIFIFSRIRRSILTRANVIVIETAVFAVSLELLIRNYLEARLYISWSAIVLTSCSLIAAALFTIITRVHLREELRRRMHI